MAGDYSRAWTIYGSSNVNVVLPTLVYPLVAAQSAKCTVKIQRITFVPSVYTGTTLTFVDSLSKLPIASIVIPAAAAPGNPQTVDFGPNGIALQQGAHLLLGGSANGALHIDAYQIPTRQGR